MVLLVLGVVNDATQAELTTSGERPCNSMNQPESRWPNGLFIHTRIQPI